MLINKNLRKKIVELIYKAKEGHIPSCFSIIDICDVFYSRILDIDKKNFKKKIRDYFILSKGHGAVALYVVLNKYNILSDKNLLSYCTNKGKLGGHPDSLTPGVDFSTGSLGHGFSNALGLALGLKIQKSNNKKVICLVGDGECNEGVVWETANLAANLFLDNFYCIVDLNNSSKKLLPIDDLKKKWQSFGWYTIAANGHDPLDLYNKFKKIEKIKNKPKVILANTVKGKGIYFMENNGSWHHKIPNLEELSKIINILS